MLVYLVFSAGGKEVREESCQLRIWAPWELTWLKIRFGDVYWGRGAGREQFSLSIVWLAWLLT